MGEESRGGVKAESVDNVPLSKLAGLFHELGDSTVSDAHLAVILLGTASVNIPQVGVVGVGVGQDKAFQFEPHSIG